MTAMEVEEAPFGKIDIEAAEMTEEPAGTDGQG
jgi:hypothetical protein